MDDLMWAELNYLNKLRPFTPHNLTEHIMRNPGQWNRVYEVDDANYTDFPNRGMLELD